MGRRPGWRSGDQTFRNGMERLPVTRESGGAPVRFHRTTLFLLVEVSEDKALGEGISDGEK
jgi:hypothetical protein